MEDGSSSAMHNHLLEGGCRVGLAMASKSVRLALAVARMCPAVALGAGPLQAC